MYFASSTLFPPFQIFANLTMFQKLFSQQDVNGVYWTLFVELLFYLCCVALFVVGRLKDSVTLFAFFFLCTSATVAPIAINKLVGTHLPVQFLSHHLSFLFLGGIIRNGLAETSSRRDQIICALGVVVAFAGVPFASGIVAPINPVHATPGQEIAFAIAYTAAIVIFMGSVALKWPTNRSLVFLGGVSYALYVMHPGCLSFIRAFVPLADDVNAYIYIVLSIVMVVSISWLVRFVVDDNCIRYGKIVRAWIDKSYGSRKHIIAESAVSEKELLSTIPYSK